MSDGQSLVSQFLAATNLRMPGKRVTVVGYGTVGREVAAIARRMGARVSVSDPARIEAVTAAGFETGTDRAEVVFVTGGEFSPTGPALVVGVEIDGPGEELRPGVTRYLVDGHELVVVAASGAESAGTGRNKIDFARRHMPALAAATEHARRSGALTGKRVGIALTLEPKTAVLVEAVASLGAEVAALGSANSTKPEVAAALAGTGVAVFAEYGAAPDRVEELRDAFIDTGIEYLADDGAGITRRIHTRRRDMLGVLRGVAEETTSGVRPLRVMAAEGALAVPAIAVNDARTKLTFDNIYGTGQSVVMAVAAVTGRRFAGQTVVVVGYGRVGRGIARFARALGARVTVTEVDPVAALTALHDGYQVVPLAEAVTTGDVVITASGIGHTLTAEHVALMGAGTVVAVGGAGPPEFDPDLGPPLEWGAEVRPGLREARVAGGNSVLVVADGYCANTSAGEGNPIEVMDLSLALQMRALDYLASRQLEPGVHLLPAEIDDDVAAAQLAAAGVVIDTPTEAQLTAAKSW